MTRKRVFSAHIRVFISLIFRLLLHKNGEMKKKIVFEITDQELEALVKSSVESVLEKRLLSATSSPLLSRNQVMSLLQIRASTLDRYTKEGKLQSYGLGGRVYFKLDEIENALIPLNRGP